MTSLNQQRFFPEMEALQITEMKSIQPYSTRDEYIYAMKEDLAEWFNSMYASNLTAHNFIDQLKSGVLICEHANNVMREAAYKSFPFNGYDLQQAGIINTANLNVNKSVNATSKTVINAKQNGFRSNTPKPMGQSAFAGEYLMYNQEPKMIMIAYDNITNFIKWCRFIVKVKECLMFETEDLTLCKNEKNFILCLLEVARFGSKFGIRVPTIIQLEQEIEAEIEQDKTNSQLNQIKIEDLSSYPKSRFIEDKQPNKEYIKSLGQNDDLAEHKLSLSPSPPPVLPKYNDSLELSHLNDEILTSSFSSISNSPSIDKLKSASSSSPPSPAHASSRSSSPDAGKKTSPPLQLEDTNANNSDFQFNLNCPSDVSSSSPVSSLTSLTASLNHEFVSRLPVIKNSSISLEKHLSPGSLLITNNKSDLKPKLNKSIENLVETTKPNDTIIAQQQHQQQPQHQHHQVNLHKHVCSIANKCTCEKKFLVDKIGEGKYRIGNTKNIVFIRILKNHIMVRVGGGWDTLENYLDKHDPCRCASDLSISNTNNNNNNNTSNTTTSSSTTTSTKRYNESEQSNNIILTPVKPSTVANSTNNSGNLNSANNSNSKGIIRVTTINCSSSSSSSIYNSPTAKLSSPTTTESSLVKSKSFLKSPNSYLTYEPDSSRAVDFTDAHLIIERDYQGKHQIGKILIPSSSTSNQIVESLNNFNNNNLTINNNNNNKNSNLIINNEEVEEMNRNLYFLNAFKHDDNSNNKKDNINNNNNNNNKSTQPSSSSTFHFSDNSTRPPPLNSDSIYSSSLISFANSTNKAESLIKTKMKKLINKIPKQQQHLLQQHSFLRKSSSSTSHSTSSTDCSSSLNYSSRRGVESPSGLLKFSRTTYLEQEQLNEFKLNTYDHHHQETPVYTETKLPARILRKYQKERSNTELLVENVIEKSDIDLSLDSPTKLDDAMPHGPSSSSQNSETASSSSYQSSFIDSKTNEEMDTLSAARTKQNSISPRLVVKSKTKLKKYKKSKTTDLSKYDDEDEQMRTSDFETDSICGDLNTQNSSSSSSSSANNQENKLFIRLATPSPILKGDLDNLNDSLELLPNDSKLEDDSLIINDNNNIIINNNNNEQDGVLSQMPPTKTNRAQWDKSRQHIDLMYFNYSKLNNQQQFKSKPVGKVDTQPRSLSQASNTPINNKNIKKVKNLNLAKEKLYEMKKTIDAKVNLNTLETKSTSQLHLTPLKSKLQPQLAQPRPAVSTAQTRTTPRKVKKRSGERSLTTGIIPAENTTPVVVCGTLNKSNSKLNLGVKSALLCASNTSINSVCTSVSTTTAATTNSYARIQTNNMKLRSRTPNHLSCISLSKMNSKTTSASLHNISNYDESSNASRNRHDSFSSTTSSFFNAPNADYKENKAYELRKKSTLMNKIITKTTQQLDPIYTRSHPISTQLDEQKLEFPSVTLTGLGSYQTSAAARKRLFAKKNEQKQQQQQQQAFDPNVSIASNGSSSTSSSKINPSPATRQSRPVTKASTNPKKPLTPRSKSNNDLYYELERTNSEQDLIELLNNCEAPVGDLQQYKIMLSECEKLQFHINKLKSQNSKAKSSNKPSGQPQVKKSSTQINVTPVSSTSVVETRRNAMKKKSDLPRTKTLKDEVKDANKAISNNVNSNCINNNNNMTSSMHRRSSSLPSYIAIPLQEQNKNMQ